MKKCFSFLIVFVFAGSLFAQTYLQPTVGVQNTYNGACLVATCSGTSYDNGGAGGNYSANINAIYRTFCPNAAGMCLRANFTSFSMNDTYFLCFGPNSCCDILSVLNGPAQNSPALYNDCVSSPGTITSSDPSGCLTFRHTTDGSVQLAGWAATLSCVACGGGPSGTSNADCAFATNICSNSPIVDQATGPGIVAEGCSGCNTSEVYTNWYRIQIASNGTLAFTIDPNVNSDDYDPVVYGPNVTCGALGAPVRCSYAAQAGNGNTGLGNGAADPSEDVAGDQWVSQLNVTAGQTYYILVNGWSSTAGANGWNMTFTGTAGLSCAILNNDFTQLYGQHVDGRNEVIWSMNHEEGISRFTVEKETPQGWKDLHSYEPGGNNSIYYCSDPNAMPGKTNYRIRMTDIKGETQHSRPVEVYAPEKQKLTVFPNPAKAEIHFDYFSTTAVNSTFRLLNSLGEEIISREFKLDADQTFSETISLSELPSGIYFMNVNGATATFVKE